MRTWAVPILKNNNKKNNLKNIIIKSTVLFFLLFIHQQCHLVNLCCSVAHMWFVCGGWREKIKSLRCDVFGFFLKPPFFSFFFTKVADSSILSVCVSVSERHRSNLHFWVVEERHSLEKVCLLAAGCSGGDWCCSSFWAAAVKHFCPDGGR